MLQKLKIFYTIFLLLDEETNDTSQYKGCCKHNKLQVLTIPVCLTTLPALESVCKYIMLIQGQQGWVGAGIGCVILLTVVCRRMAMVLDMSVSVLSKSVEWFSVLRSFQEGFSAIMSALRSFPCTIRADKKLEKGFEKKQ